MKENAVVSLTDEMRRSYLDYSMSVIVSRALPDLRDGLKPVHRRVLYAMKDAGYTHNKQYRKCARIVGDVIGKYHPHGESAVYDSLVRMAQNFSLRITLIDGQGNFGSIDGDNPAAMRYTEARLDKSADLLLADINYDTVDFKKNYDASEEEPEVLPAMFPNILVNGSGGIAVGMATNIPPHNLNEVIDACLAYIDNHNISNDELINIVTGPDFPTAGIIVGSANIKNAYRTGRGIITLRGRTEIEQNGNRESIIITEIPYMVNKAKMIEKIAELVKEEKIVGISDLRDESNKEGIRVVIELKKDACAAVITNQLHSYTPLQTSFGINMVVLDGGIPKLMNLREIIASFISFRHQVITRRTNFLLAQARAEAHILIGLQVAIDNIDLVIEIIRSSQDYADAKQKLSDYVWNVEKILPWLVATQSEYNELNNTYQLTEKQVKAILDMRIHKLTALEHTKISQELQSLMSDISNYLSILSSKAVLFDLMKKEMQETKTAFGTNRLTEIDENFEECEVEDLIPKEDMVVICTLSGYIKRVPLSSYRTQKRGGRGKNTVSAAHEDVPTQVFVGNTHSPMLFFSSSGQVYGLKLYKLPQGTPQTKGRAIVNLLPYLKQNETINNILLLPDNVDELENLNIVFATSKGYIRRNSLDDFRKINANGKIAIKLDETDRLVNVCLCHENDHVFISTEQGKSIRFPVADLRVFRSRSSEGVIGIKMRGSDKVISMMILSGHECDIKQREEYLDISYRDRIQIASGDIELLRNYQFKHLSNDEAVALAKDEEFILSVTRNGYGKCSSAYEYRVTNRSGMGITNMNISSKTGNLMQVFMFKAMDQDLMLITSGGKLLRVSIADMRILGRDTSGVMMCRLNNDEHVIGAALIESSKEESEE